MGQVENLENQVSSNDSCLGEIHVSITVFMCLVFFLGLILNTFSIWVFFFKMPKWTSGTTLQFNLALSDAIATPVTPMLAVYFTMDNHWPFGDFLCKVKIALLSCHFYGSTIFLTLISVQRYCAVVRFNRKSYMKKKTFVRNLCAGIWVLLLVQGLVYAFLLSTSEKAGKDQCLSIHQTKLTDIYFVINFVLFILGFLLPLLVSTVCYSRLAHTLTGLNINSSVGLQVKVKSQRMIGMCLVIFSLCFLPLNVVRTVAVVLKKYYPKQCLILKRIETAYYISLVLAGVNCCLDPLLYCFGSQKFRDAFKSLRKRKKETPNRSDQEMTADL